MLFYLRLNLILSAFRFSQPTTRLDDYELLQKHKYTVVRKNVTAYFWTR